MFVKWVPDIFKHEGVVIWLKHVCLQPLEMKWDGQDLDSRGPA